MVTFCFPTSAQVQLASGIKRQVSCLKTYDQLQTLGLDKAGKKLTRSKTTQFLAFLHFDRDLSSEFLVLSCEHETQLVISEAHLLFRKSSQMAAAKPTMARNVEVGDYLLHVDANKEIQSVKVLGIERKTFQGVFAPLTKSGTLIVDGFLVSCYAHVDSQAKAHASMAPLRLWYKLNSKVGKPKTKLVEKIGIHVYGQILASVYRLS